MKKRLTIFLLLILILPLAFAQSKIIVGKKSGEATISSLGQAAFEITVSNERNVDDIFVLELSDVAWSLSAKDASDYTTGVYLSGYESKTTTIYVKPFKAMEPGTYYVELRIRSRETGDYSSELFSITIDPKVVDYSITLPVEVLEPTSIDPQRTGSIKILIKNPNPVFLTNISVETSSKFLNKVATVDITPNSEKVVDFALNLDASTPKQEDVLNVYVKQAGKTIGSAQKTMYIKEFRLPYKVDSTTEKKFLRTVHTVTFTNTEGAVKTQDASLQRPDTYALILTEPASGSEVFDGQSYIVWSGISLNPGEKYVVTVTEDYREIAGGIILVLALIIIYYKFRSPIIVMKKAYALKKKDTGNNELKIVLHIRNRSGRTLEKVRVLDRLPLIHRVEEDFGPGTPEPKYRRTHDGVILDWDIVLSPREERIFTYKVKSALPIVGEMTLRPCVVQYGKSNRRASSGEYRMAID